MKKILPFLTVLFTLQIATAQLLPNGDFESFATETFGTFERQGGMFNSATCQIDGGEYIASDTRTGEERPTGFRTSDDYLDRTTPTYVTQTMDAVSGSAIRLSSDFVTFGLLGIFDVETLVQDAVPVDYPFGPLPVAITGFYKHTSGNSVTIPAGSCASGGPLAEATVFEGGFAIYAQFFDAEENLIAEVDTVLQDAATYTEFNIPVTILTPGAVPATYLFILSSCPEFLSPNMININGSESFVDEVDFEFVTSTQELVSQQQAFELFPNPTTGLLHLRSELPLDEPFYILDQLGRVCMSGVYKSEIAIQHFPAGVYFFKYGGEVQRLVKQ
ncbi:MAG: T9SS type A sorting domain-containing protein [Bacteroidota bacterium]